MKEVEKLCHDNDILLIIDEVQTGIGRCGSLFAYEQYGIKPDIMSLAKGLGGGFPIGATLATDKVAVGFEPGDHGSTFGGNPLACAAANTVLDIIAEDPRVNISKIDEYHLIENTKKMGQYTIDKLNGLKEKYDLISDVRGLGLLIGIELSMDGGDIVDKMREKGILINCTAGKVLRLAPALIITEENVDTMVQALDDIFSKINN